MYSLLCCQEECPITPPRPSCAVPELVLRLTSFFLFCSALWPSPHSLHSLALRTGGVSLSSLFSSLFSLHCTLTHCTHWTPAVPLSLISLAQYTRSQPLTLCTDTRIFLLQRTITSHSSTVASILDHFIIQDAIHFLPFSLHSLAQVAVRCGGGGLCCTCTLSGADGVRRLLVRHLPGNILSVYTLTHSVLSCVAIY